MNQLMLKNASMFLVFFATLFLSTARAAGICDRNSDVQNEIVRQGTNKNCADVTPQDLAQVKQLHLPFYPNLVRGDLDGLTSLETLDLEIVDAGSLSPRLFRDLTALKNLYVRSNSGTTSASWLVKLTSLVSLSLDIDENCEDLGFIHSGAFSTTLIREQCNPAQNSVTKMQQGTWTQFKKLKTLGLPMNNNFDFMSGAFDGLSELTEISFSRAMVSHIGKGAFHDLAKVAGKFSFEGVSQLDSGAFVGLNSLSELSVSGSFTEVPADAFNGTFVLKTLNIKASQTLDISDRVFEGLPKLESLTLSEVRHIPHMTAKLKRLEFNLDDGHAQKDDFLGQENLEFLKIVELDPVPGLFSGLSQLREAAIYLKSSDFDLSKMFDKHEHLEKLTLTSVLHSNVSQEMFLSFPNLKDMSLNVLEYWSHFPGSLFKNAPKLETLFLGMYWNDGHDCSMPEELLFGSSKLKNLTVYSLTHFEAPARFIQDAPLLEQLKLTARIGNLPDGFFSNSKALKNVDLSENGISNAEQGHIRAMLPSEVKIQF